MNDTHLDKRLDKRLEQQIEQLPKNIKPTRDLWAGIDHAIEQQSYQQAQRSWHQWGVVAAGLVVFAWLSWLTLNVDSNGMSPLPTNNEQVVAQQVPEPMSYVNDLSNVFEAQKQALLVQYGTHESVVEDWQQELEELNKAADAIKQALRADPSNSQLIKMLQQTYQQQLDLIKMVNRSPWQRI